MNAPDPILAVIKDERLEKVTEIRETKINNACKYIIEAEDHTLGNVLRMDMIDDPNVTFVGYRIPHPLNTNIEFRVQTVGPNYPPSKAMTESCTRIMKLCKDLSDDIQLFEQKRSNANEDHLF